MNLRIVRRVVLEILHELLGLERKHHHEGPGLASVRAREQHICNELTRIEQQTERPSKVKAAEGEAEGAGE